MESIDLGLRKLQNSLSLINDEIAKREAANAQARGNKKSKKLSKHILGSFESDNDPKYGEKLNKYLEKLNDLGIRTLGKGEEIDLSLAQM